MSKMDKVYEERAKANDIFETLKENQSMCEIADIVESLDENMAKLVLKKFIYSRGKQI